MTAKIFSRSFFLAGLATLLTFLAAARADDRAQTHRGHDIAVRICATCHAVEQEQTRSPFKAAPPFEQIANARAMTQLALRVALQSSHPIMPNVRLSEGERTDVIAYLMSLKRTSMGALDTTHRYR
jgi:mono/diheme cytochrome c family protein